jgi:hypothetical protein
MHRRNLLASFVSAAVLAGCEANASPLAVITDPDLDALARTALLAYQGQHAGLRWTITPGAASDLYALAEADGARVLITRETRLADNLQRTRRAPLENRWTMGPKDAPIALVVTKGAGEATAKAFAQWLVSREGQSALDIKLDHPAPAPTAP